MQCICGNCLTNHSGLNKIYMTLLRSMQDQLKGRNGSFYSIITLQQMCTAPAGAIEISNEVMPVSDWAADFKS